MPDRPVGVLVLREARAQPVLRSGREVAARILHARFADDAGPTADADGGLLDFQRDAALRARAIIARRGGVLIADSVGLGKTHIALEVLRPSFRSGARVAIVAPSALRRHWHAAVGERGAFEWVSYATLSRGRPHAAPFDFIVFDEAHALRNANTQRYRHAIDLIRDARVVLLTATPVNNSTSDLYNLLRLFASDRAFTDVGVPSLRAAFDEAESTCLLGAAPSLQPVLRAVMIRRTRHSLGTSPTDRARAAGIVFPEQEAPVPVWYAFDRVGGIDLLEHVGGALLELEFPAHRQDGGTAVELMRQSLFKRLESSVHALRRSLAAYDALLARVARGLERGLLVHAGDRFGRSDDDTQLALDTLLYQPAPMGPASADMRFAVERERDIVGRMRVLLDRVADPKFDALADLLTGTLRGRRTIVFTQFRDTARYLHARLAHRCRAALVDGGGALLGVVQVDRMSVVRRFAPVASGAPAPARHEAVDVLIATDVLSEGFNLQDASTVVSYDLPWNPIRLVQRIGRIDRLGSPHARVSSFHFLPGDLERYLGLLDRIARKTSAIEATVGIDMPMLHAEVVRALDRRDGELLDRIERDDIDVDERLRALRGRMPAPVDDARLALAVIAGADGTPQDSVSGLVVARIGARTEWLAVRNGEPALDDRYCARLLEAAAAQELAGPAPPARAIDRLLDAGRRGFLRRIAVASRTPLLPADGAAGRIGRRLLALAAELPGGPDPILCRRLESAMQCLVSAHGPDLLALPSIPGGPPASTLTAVLDAIEHLPAHRPEPADAASEEGVTLIAALLAPAPDR